MPVAGLEPARGCPRQILSLLRLPFRHTGLRVVTTRNIIAHFWELGKYKLEKNFFSHYMRKTGTKFKERDYIWID